VPPLRERRDDIPILMNHFLGKYRHRHKRTVTGFTARAIDALLNYELPGNIRELENMIERGVILAPSGGAIDVSHLFIGGENLHSVSFGLSGDGRVGSGGRLDADGGATTGTDPADVIRSITARCEQMMSDDENADAVSLDDIETSLETALLQSAIKRAKGNLSAAARSLGLTRARLVYRLNNRGLGQTPN